MNCYCCLWEFTFWEPRPNLLCTAILSSIHISNTFVSTSASHCYTRLFLCLSIGWSCEWSLLLQRWFTHVLVLGLSRGFDVWYLCGNSAVKSWMLHRRSANGRRCGHHVMSSVFQRTVVSFHWKSMRLSPILYPSSSPSFSSSNLSVSSSLSLFNHYSTVFLCKRWWIAILNQRPAISVTPMTGLDVGSVHFWLPSVIPFIDRISFTLQPITLIQAQLMLHVFVCLLFNTFSNVSFFPVWPPPLQLQNYLRRLTRVAFRLMISCESSFVEPRECNGVGTYCLVYWFEFLSILLQRQQRFYRRISCSLICLVCWCCNNWLISRATQCRLLSHSDLLPGLNVCVANSTWHLSPMLLTANDSSQF